MDFKDVLIKKGIQHYYINGCEIWQRKCEYWKERVEE